MCPITYRDTPGICASINLEIIYSQIYWFGDLNYRITEMDPTTVKCLIEKKDFKSIILYEQLQQNHRAGRIFEKYKEGKINFRPTYKYDTGSDEWDSRYEPLIVKLLGNL